MPLDGVSFSQDWIDYNGIAFSIEVTRIGSHSFFVMERLAVKKSCHRLYSVFLLFHNYIPFLKSQL